MTFLWIVLSLSVVPVSYQPGQPTVGDLVIVNVPIRMGEKILVRPSDRYEVVSTASNRIVVRAFQPGPFLLEGVIAGESGRRTFRGPEIRVRSVLSQNDSLKPAGLKPPVAIETTSAQWITIASAAAACVLIWGAVAGRKQGLTQSAGEALTPAQEYRAVIMELRRRPPSDEGFALLADATRRFLSRVEPGYGRELTTFELLTTMHRRGSGAPSVAHVRNLLREGDLAKFSPWGTGALSHDQTFVEAESLIALTAPTTKAS